MENIQVSIVMGSVSDYETVKETVKILEDFNVSFEKKVVSAHRTPEDMVLYAKSAKEKGIQVIIAAAGGAAHLPGMIASLTELPVIGIPIKSQALNGMDSLLSIVQMPAGVPVMTMAIGVAGAKNAALAAMRIVGLQDPLLQEKLRLYQAESAQQVRSAILP
ncbi:MAG: 5-(carboxyamino)imidazole ribonucleotide mutase [Firmicutes bacterium GWF2_51_9]|nr:5-(carboxyamino)imidazole ribonucleotide mutase [Erysipelotrichaceae bacterium]OGS53020.1 MAG: 5-(carboxyamino)imidazole ribonucleotide mutase [Firmicutes bacterium GWF2_51_9]OGS57385.1 MAG: 5-(carboxyamino)imidazole ribonucleotide mutase [Firmicutes bacterium GWE2_51_13]HAM63828.1 5-(carboxyamino)imidazole ribonucleotide mutase [Erysipelotrichaceae bacterium]HAO60926.1 5-(carboxyamino)imidazole ribonucleotide mutase [Erysipelotrichaceae bacterium]